MSEHKITVHHLNVSRSERLFWALEELQLPYDVKVYLRLPSRAAPPELTKVSPYGKAPVLELDGETITESAYIIHRLLKLVPDNTNVEAVPSDSSLFWAHFAEGSQMNLFQAGAIVAASSAGWASGSVGGLDEAGRAGVKKYGQWLTESYLKSQNQTNLDQIEDFLAKNPGKMFSGSDKPGIGDFMMFFSFNSLLNGSRKDAGYTIGPHSKKYFDTVTARPAVKKALERIQKEEEGAKARI